MILSCSILYYYAITCSIQNAVPELTHLFEEWKSFIVRSELCVHVCLEHWPAKCVWKVENSLQMDLWRHILRDEKKQWVGWIWWWCLFCASRELPTSKEWPEQESSPAWTQEACRPPRNKYSFCYPNRGGGEVPHPWWGYLGYPLSVWTWLGYTPCLHLAGGPPPHASWMGYPLPPLWTWLGYPPIWTWPWYPPPLPKVWTDWKHYLPSSFGCGR